MIKDAFQRRLTGDVSSQMNRIMEIPNPIQRKKTEEETDKRMI